MTILRIDAAGSMTSLINAQGNQTQWQYDNLDRVIKKLYADGTSNNYGYTKGLLTQFQNARGETTQYAYDNNANLTNINYPNMTDVGLDYNNLNQLTSMTDGFGTTNYGYNTIGQINSEDGPWTNDTLGYAYDSLGRETGVGLNGTTVSTYGYDDLNRFSSLNSIAGNFTYNYVGNSGLMNQIDLPNGAKSTFTYDALERLTQVQSQTSGSANIAKFGYTLDNRDIRTAQEKTFGAAATQHIDYGYDTVNQLTSALSTETPPLVNQSWNYDPMGNRTQTVGIPTTGDVSTSTYTNNSLNQIAQITNVTGSNTTESTFSYDEDGNTTQVASDNATTQYTYDDVDRLGAVVYKNGMGVNVSKSTYTYDGLSRLRIITKYTWDTGTSAWVQQSQKKFVYDGMQVIQERDGDDNVVATNIWDGNIGGLEARVVYDVETPANPPQKYFYHYDGSGNVSAVTNETQEIMAQYEYDAYGNLINSSGAYASQNPWRFSTKYYDAGSGLYYYGYRFYSPGLGKWINRDPISESGGLNLYGFVGNNPVHFVDPYGLWKTAEPSTWFDGNGYQGSGLDFNNVSWRDNGAAAGVDGLVRVFGAPAYEISSNVFSVNLPGPMESLGGYNPNDPSMKWSKGAGQVAGYCIIAWMGSPQGAGSGGAVTQWGPGSKWVMRGPASWRNWIMSGKSRQFPLKSGKTWTPPPGKVGPVRGRPEGWKTILGQSQLK